MMLMEDLKHKSRCYYDGRADWKSILKVFLSDGTSAVILYRWAQWMQNHRLGIIASVLIILNKFLNGCVIGRHAQFGPGLVLMHPVGVVINGGVKGGENVVIESGVVIGAARNGFPVQTPQLGNDVFIGAGAKVLGDLTIGNHVLIGANAVVLHDVPDQSTAVGMPAKAIPRRTNHVD